MVSDFYLWDIYKKNVKPLDTSKARPKNYNFPREKQTSFKNKPSFLKYDLHGYKVHDAYLFINEIIPWCYNNDINYCIIITGKKGKIREEFTFWINNLKTFIKDCYPNKDDGSFTVELLKRK